MQKQMNWRKSSRSGNLGCVELTFSTSGNLVRDSKDPGQILDIPARAACQLILFLKI